MQPDAETQALRELAERLTRASLYPGALPENLSLDVPVPPGGRLIGGVRHPPFTPPGAAEPVADQRFDVLIDAPGEVSDLLSFFEAAFAAQGWREPGQQHDIRERVTAYRERAGSRARRLPESLTMTDGNRWIGAVIQPDASGMKDIRIGVHPPPRGEHREIQRFLHMPELTAPEGGTIHHGGSGGTDAGMYREWRLETSLGIAQTEAHVARQLTAAGWSRRDGGAQGPVAWSRWSVPDEPEQEGPLLIFESAVQPRYIVHLRKARPSSAEPIGSGGVIVQTRLQPIVPEEEPPASK